MVPIYRTCSKNIAQDINKDQEKTPSGDVKYTKIENTTYEVVSNYVGKDSLLDIVKSAIRRDIESGNY